MTKEVFKELLKECFDEYLSIEISTHSGCGCCNNARMRIEVKFDDEVICSDFIYLSSLKTRD